jgi:Tfp pilus assembly protein PilF
VVNGPLSPRALSLIRRHRSPPHGRRPAPPAAADPTQAKPAALKIGSVLAGDSGSAEALKRLHGALAELRSQAVVPMLQEALNRLKAHDVKGGADLALKALSYDEDSGLGWYVLAIAREKAGDYGAAVRCYERALALLPDASDIANDLGRLAYRLGMTVVAESSSTSTSSPTPARSRPPTTSPAACATRCGSPKRSRSSAPCSTPSPSTPCSGTRLAPC